MDLQGSIRAVAEEVRQGGVMMAPYIWSVAAGNDRLKEALQAVGLKSGGTMRQRAERLMLLRGTTLEQLDRKHFAPGAVPAVRSASLSPAHILLSSTCLPV